MGVVDGGKDEPNGEIHTTMGNESLPKRDIASTEVETYIREVFQTDEAISWALSTCQCESGCSPNAVSPSGRYIGIYQFCHSTFNSNCDGNIYEWKNQVRCTKKIYDEGGIGHWPVCGS